MELNSVVIADCVTKIEDEIEQINPNGMPILVWKDNLVETLLVLVNSLALIGITATVRSVEIKTDKHVYVCQHRGYVRNVNVVRPI